MNFQKSVRVVTTSLVYILEVTIGITFDLAQLISAYFTPISLYYTMKLITSWSCHIHGHDTIYCFPKKLDYDPQKKFSLPCWRMRRRRGMQMADSRVYLCLPTSELWHHDIILLLRVMASVRLVTMFRSSPHHPTMHNMHKPENPKI